jgi:hypothetical protein
MMRARWPWTPFEFDVREEDGGEGRLGGGVANSRQHRVWEVEVVGQHCGFLVVKKKNNDEKKSSSSIVECKTTN